MGSRPLWTLGQWDLDPGNPVTMIGTRRTMGLCLKIERQFCTCDSQALVGDYSNRCMHVRHGIVRYVNEIIGVEFMGNIHTCYLMRHESDVAIMLSFIIFNNV